jgi:hypothetical protein
MSGLKNFTSYSHFLSKLLEHALPEKETLNSNRKSRNSINSEFHPGE